MVGKFSTFIEEVRIRNEMYPYAVQAVRTGFPVEKFCEWYWDHGRHMRLNEEGPGLFTRAANWLTRPKGFLAAKQSVLQKYVQNAHDALSNLAWAMNQNPNDPASAQKTEIEKLKTTLSGLMGNAPGSTAPPPGAGSSNTAGTSPSGSATPAGAAGTSASSSGGGGAAAAPATSSSAGAAAGNDIKNDLSLVAQKIRAVRKDQGEIPDLEFNPELDKTGLDKALQHVFDYLPKEAKAEFKTPRDLLTAGDAELELIEKMAKGDQRALPAYRQAKYPGWHQTGSDTEVLDWYRHRLKGNLLAEHRLQKSIAYRDRRYRH